MNDQVLTIEPDPQGGRIVRVGDRYAELSTDECLWAVASFLMGSECHWLKTKERHEADRAAWMKNAATSIEETKGTE